jgi:predicted NBD/HSP70 family sugar kinase
MYILLDIGGTSTRIAISRSGENLDEVIKMPTVADFSEAVGAIENIVGKYEGAPVLGVCVGIAGPLDPDHSMTINAPHLPLWNGQPLKETLESMMQAPVVLENDCVLAGVGEASLGAGKNLPLVVYMTVSTGVGGARIIDGVPDVSRYGFEPGHQIISIDGEKFSLEQLISGTAIERRYGKKAESIDDPAVWERVAEDLAVGLNNTLVHWSPDIIILGGSVMKKIPLDMLRKKFKEAVSIFPNVPPLERALLDESVLWGALMTAKRNSDKSFQKR